MMRDEVHLHCSSVINKRGIEASNDIVRFAFEYSSSMSVIVS